MSKDRIKRVAVLQRVCPGYRLPFFQALARMDGYQLRLFIGEDLPNSKVKSIKVIDGVDCVKLKTRFVNVGREFPMAVHAGLFRELAAFVPDVIISEGESNLLSLLVALVYARLKRIPVIHWSLGGLPGEAPKSGGRKAIRNLIRRRFDAFVVYSSFGKACLVNDGLPREKIFVAVNVPDVQKLLQRAMGAGVSKSQARERIGIPNRFTVLYVGSMDTHCKRLDLLVDIASDLSLDSCNVVCVGDGPIRDEMSSSAQGMSLNNLFLPGAVSSGIDDYYLAADVFVLPGRGGMVIAEAMAFGLPVIVFNADGTERDLVENGASGIILESGSVDEFVRVIRDLNHHDDKIQRMSADARARISRFDLAGMVRGIGAALDCVVD